jgi:DNA-binding NarL/FixJ family response regulator
MPHATEMSLPNRTSPLRVFVVEDSRKVRELLTEQLNDIEGVLVVGTAESERSAVEGLHQTPCDVVILDIKLSEGSGIGVLRALEKSPIGTMTRVIFSNYTESEYRTLARRLGAEHYFDKSTDFIALITLISSLSNRH